MDHGSILGIAAGREPRAAAEELRQLLTEQLGQTYGEVKVEFKTVEDLDTLVNIAGTNMAVARYALGVTFKVERGDAPNQALLQPPLALRKNDNP